MRSVTILAARSDCFPFVPGRRIRLNDCMNALSIIARIVARLTLDWLDHLRVWNLIWIESPVTLDAA
jgi:hypothetical protein